MGLKIKDILPFATARPDDRGRITLGSAITKDVSRFDVYFDEATGEVLLRPFKEIPSREAWLYQNEKARDLVAAGLQSAKAGSVKKIDLSNTRWIEDVEDGE